MLIAANFKTNKTRVQTAEYYRAVSTFIAENSITSDAMVFPPATALDSFDGTITASAQHE